MATLIEHLIKLTDHRDRDLLELTLSKALIDLVPIQRVLVSKVISEEGIKRWMDVTVLDARGGGKVIDPLRLEFKMLPLLEDNRDRLRCIQKQERVEVAWAGENGPRITYLPLFSDPVAGDQGVLEIHSATALLEEHLAVVNDMSHVFRNMFRLLAYSDRDALTGLLNRKSLDGSFYNAVLQELGKQEDPAVVARQPVLAAGQERRYRVPPNYWLGTIYVNDFDAVNNQHGNLVAEEVLLLVARNMNSTFRTYDRLYRFAGAQFAVLMHCPDEALVLSAFERFRAKIEKFNFPQLGRLSISGGLTRVSPDDAPGTALERAEQAVRYAQEHGLHKVFSHAELVRKGVLAEGPK